MVLSYLPFSEIRQNKAIIVDCFHPNGLVLSHWRGAPTPAALREDTSAGIVLQALKQNWPDLQNYRYVTANHFDIDALVGVWALLNPEKALQNEETLRQMAVIGDFRELDLSLPHAQKALQLVCWVNAEENTRFYRPFGAKEIEENEETASVPKFRYFLEAFGQVLEDSDKFKSVWQPEYEQVLVGLQQINGPETKLESYPDCGLICIHTPSPVAYYALFSVTKGFDLVLTLYPDQWYELETKYTTWVDLVSRDTLPRPNFKILATRLNKMETSGKCWKADGPTDTGPLLRLEQESLSKAQRYANPITRTLHSSSILPEKFILEVLSFLRTFYQDIKPKKFWTWAEVKKLHGQN